MLCCCLLRFGVCCVVVLVCVFVRLYVCVVCEMLNVVFRGVLCGCGLFSGCDALSRLCLLACVFVVGVCVVSVFVCVSLCVRIDLFECGVVRVFLLCVSVVCDCLCVCVHVCLWVWLCACLLDCEND